jgi:hypothetical protein
MQQGLIPAVRTRQIDLLQQFNEIILPILMEITEIRPQETIQGLYVHRVVQLQVALQAGLVVDEAVVVHLPEADHQGR